MEKLEENIFLAALLKKQIKDSDIKMEYAYTLGDNLEEPLKYNYTAYHGRDFIRSWYLNRMRALLSINEQDREYAPEHFCAKDTAFRMLPVMNESEIFVGPTLHEILQTLLTCKPVPEELKQLLDGCVKTFEVRKRLYPVYSLRFKPEDENSYHDIRLYIIFACVCVEAFRFYQDFRYLNALLKVNDTVLSQWNREPALKEKENQRQVAFALRMEIEFVMDICRRKGIDLQGVENENT